MYNNDPFNSSDSHPDLHLLVEVVDPLLHCTELNLREFDHWVINRDTTTAKKLFSCSIKEH